jgi:iron-sulfur cluster repair protein YtfE (RIC family)
MTGGLEELRNEHRELAVGINALKETAEFLGSGSTQQIAERLRVSLEFLSHQLIPHAKAEEEVLYRAYDQLANSPWATDTMRRDHSEVARLTDRLEKLSREWSDGAFGPSVGQDLKETLFGLYAILRLHFANEETLIVPRLEQGLSPDAIRHLIHALEERAHAA